VVDFIRLEASREKLIGFLGNNGYPFASVRVDSIRLDGSLLRSRVLLERGPLYRIDSILPSGGGKISRNFLYRYLDIPAGSIYRKDKLDQISRKLLELPFLKETRPWDMTMLGTGSTINLYLEQKKSSQMNLLVGFLPDNTQVGGKLLLTGEANMNLRNAFGTGETIIANWQQIQVQSPRLNLAYNQPYIFHSAFGLDTYFDLLRKDSSFLNISARLGFQYLVSARQTGKLFFQQQSTNLLTVDTAMIKATKRLPVYLDVTNTQLGIDYQFVGTDYRFNPRKGTEASLTLSGGVRRIRENAAITTLTEDASGKPFDFSSLYDTLHKKQYLIRVKASLTRYFKTSRQSTIKASMQGGSIFSRDLFRNELFQIGGYRLLRGFDEESIFANAYGVGTIEYRYLIGLNSFLFAFTDIGFAGVSDHTEQYSHRYLGAGLGLSFETRAGIFNLAYAAGKREDLPFDLRQSKIHFGLVSFF
jgi:outer membrane protein assembly factor BamA